jgi:hypothetical protein
MILLSSSLKRQKLCVNCKYFIPDGNWFSSQNFAKCSKITKKNYDVNHLITGKVVVQKEEYYYCSTARASDSMCGIAGNNYIRNKKNNKNKREDEDDEEDDLLV